MLHAGDLICEGTIKMAAEPAAKPAEAAEAKAGAAPADVGEAAADAAAPAVSVAPQEGGAIAQEPLRDTDSRSEVRPVERPLALCTVIQCLSCMALAGGQMPRPDWSFHVHHILRPRCGVAWSITCHKSSHAGVSDWMSRPLILEARLKALTKQDQP